MSDDPARILLSDASYDGQFARTLTAAYAGAADLGEAYATARRVTRPDGERWCTEWSATAARVRAEAESSLARGHRRSARLGLLRASEYWRQAFYFVRHDLDAPALQQTYAAHRDSFVAALDLHEHPAELVRIPYTDETGATTLRGYLFSPDDSGRARATLVFPCGYDSTAEAGWLDVSEALAHGYQALAVEGPGQGETLYVQRRYFRPDWEQVLTPVVDWLLTRAEVDPARIGLVGRSFAGYLAPRAATVEHRFAAMVADPAQPDMAAHLPSGLAGAVAVPVVEAMTKMSAQRREFFGARMVAHGLTSVEEYFAELERFRMLDRAKEITCPTLVVEAEHDFAGGGGATLAAAMTAPTTQVPLTAATGADGHCAGTGRLQWARVVYDWLDEALA